MSEPSKHSDKGRGEGPLVVLVTGLPATGKTSVARRLAVDHHLPLACKDEIKELLYDTLGWSQGTPEAREWSRQLGLVAVGLLFQYLRSHVSVGRPCIIESNFHPDAADELRALHTRVPFRMFQVLCRTRGDVLLARFHARAQRRHPGHDDARLEEELRPVLLSGGYEPLALEGTLWELDTTRWSEAKVAELSAAVGAAL